MTGVSIRVDVEDHPSLGRLVVMYVETFGTIFAIRMSAEHADQVATRLAEASAAAALTITTPAIEVP